MAIGRTLRRLVPALLILPGIAAPAPADTLPPKPVECFRLQDWGDFKATKDFRAIYIRVSHRAIYRLGLDSACPVLRNPDARLITTGTIATICAPIDINLTVSNPTGASERCIVRDLARLSRDEEATLPKDLVP